MSTMKSKIIFLFIFICLSWTSSAETNYQKIAQDIDIIKQNLKNPDLGSAGFNVEIDKLEKIKKVLAQCPSLMTNQIK